MDETILLAVYNFQDDFLESVSKELSDYFEAAVEQRNRTVIIYYGRRHVIRDKSD